MKRIPIFLSALALASCINEKDYQPESQGGKFAFTAGFSDDTGPESRVILDHNYQYGLLYVLWENGDEVSVFDGENHRKFVSDRDGLSTSLILEEGDFIETASEYFALYPYTETADFTTEPGYVKTTLPAVQYARRDAFSSHLAIASTSQESKEFVFKNVTAVFKANITKEGITSIVFASKNNEKVAGDIKISFDDATYQFLDEENCSATVTICPPRGQSTFVPGVYYFTILPQTFSTGFTITIDSNSSPREVREVKGSDIYVPRSSLSIGKAIGTEGDGTEGDPYLIANKYDLEGLATIVADDKIDYDQTTYIRFVDDIDMGGITSWIPINNIRDAEYISKLDVNGQKSDGENAVISNWAPQSFATGQIVNNGSTQNTKKSQPSMFGIVRGTVRNLTIQGAEMDLSSTGTSMVGVLAGWIGYYGLSDRSTVDNVHISDCTVQGNKVVAGLAGFVYNSDVIDCSAIDVEISGSGEHTAGLVARFDRTVNIQNCHTTGTVTGISGVGGLLGANEIDKDDKSESGELKVKNCSSECTVQGNYQVGGLIGYTKYKTSIERSYVNADVTGSGRQIGGILGVLADGPKLDVSECFYHGNISADGSYVGGIVGYSKAPCSISNCHAWCNIENTGNNHTTNGTDYDMLGVGGILGGHSSKEILSVDSCFVDAGIIKSKAWGTLTTNNRPTTWDSWVKATASTSRTEYYLGGAVGGIVGYSACTSTKIFRNLAYVKKIECDRTSVLDASCAPIAGCLCKDSNANDDKTNDDNTNDDNRYYRSSDQSVQMELNDNIDGKYKPHSVGGILDAVVYANSLGGEEVNQYCLYTRPLKNYPSSTAGTWWDTNNIWNNADLKLFLRAHEAVYNKIVSTQAQ